ncbi:MAG: hypothetical protein WA960_11505 [Tunicatimonas sp.]
MELLAVIARKMGFQTEISNQQDALDATNETALLSEPSLAEDWLSEDDEVYNRL